MSVDLQRDLTMHPVSGHGGRIIDLDGVDGSEKGIVRLSTCFREG